MAKKKATPANRTKNAATHTLKRKHDNPKVRDHDEPVVADNPRVTFDFGREPKEHKGGLKWSRGATSFNHLLIESTNGNTKEVESVPLKGGDKIVIDLASATDLSDTESVTFARSVIDGLTMKIAGKPFKKVGDKVIPPDDKDMRITGVRTTNRRIRRIFAEGDALRFDSVRVTIKLTPH